MQRSRNKSLLSLFLLFTISFFISRDVLAISVVESEFEMLLPRKFQQNLIEQYWTKLQKEDFIFSWEVPNQTYDTSDVKVDLSGIKIDVQSRLQKPQVVPGGDSVLLQSSELQATLFVKSIEVDQFIEREVGGVIGRFRIQAKCEDVKLAMNPGQGFFSMKLSPVFRGPVLKGQVAGADLSWSQDAWSVTELRCSGAQGFDEIIKSEVLKVAGNSATFVEKYKTILMEFVQNYVDTKTLDISTPRSLKPLRSDIEVSLQFQSLSTNAKQAILRGILRVNFLREKKRDAIFLKLAADPFTEEVKSGGLLRIPEDLILILMKQAFVKNSFIQRLHSDQVPGFSALMQSRLKQLFVWPELKKYPKSSDFLFDLSTGENLAIRGQNLKYQVQTGIKVRMYAPRDNNYAPFMNFSIPLKSQVQLEIKNAEASVRFSKVSLDLIPSWSASYVEEYHPWQRFAKDKILSRVKTAAEGAAVSAKIPALPITETVSLQVDHIQPIPNSKNILVYLH